MPINHCLIALYLMYRSGEVQWNTDAELNTIVSGRRWVAGGWFELYMWVSKDQLMRKTTASLLLKERTGKLSEAPVRLGLREWRLDTHQGQRQLIDTTFSLSLLPVCTALICLAPDKQQGINSIAFLQPCLGLSPRVTLCVPSLFLH